MFFKKSSWNIPENAKDFFNPSYEEKYKKQHPFLYWLSIISIIIMVILGPFIFGMIIMEIEHTSEFDFSFIELLVFAIGLFSSFGISIGLCNLFLILHKQYFGHLLTMISFAIGILGIAFSAVILWLFK